MHHSWTNNSQPFERFPQTLTSKSTAGREVQRVPQGNRIRCAEPGTHFRIRFKSSNQPSRNGSVLKLCGAVDMFSHRRDWRASHARVTYTTVRAHQGHPLHLVNHRRCVIRLLKHTSARLLAFSPAWRYSSYEYFTFCNDISTLRGYSQFKKYSHFEKISQPLEDTLNSQSTLIWKRYINL